MGAITAKISKNSSAKTTLTGLNDHHHHSNHKDITQTTSATTLTTENKKKTRTFTYTDKPPTYIYAVLRSYIKSATIGARISEDARTLGAVVVVVQEQFTTCTQP